MKDSAYQTLADQEDRNWYYLVRQKIVGTLIRDFPAKQFKRLHIVDIGCGTGGTTQFLTNFGAVVGSEPSELARRLLAQKYPHLKVVPKSIDDLRLSDLPCRPNVATVMGVFYHKNIADPQAAVAKLAGLLEPGGYFIWNETSYDILKRHHDVVVEGGRKFTPRSLRRYLDIAGFDVVVEGPLLAWGFLPALMLSLAYRFGRRTEKEATQSEDKPLPWFLNSLLYWLSYGEWCFSRYILRLPMGVSYLLLARKR